MKCSFPRKATALPITAMVRTRATGICTTAPPMGLYSSSAEEEYVPYPHPQEHGNHYGVKLLRIGNMEFSAQTPFECNVSNYSTQALYQAKHTDELAADGSIHLRIDYKVSGLGSNSCGPVLDPKYRLAEKEIHFAFSITPAG